MAEETGSFDSARMAEQVAEQVTKRIQEMMANYSGSFQNSPSARGSTNLHSRLLNRASEHMGAASLYVNRLSQATDLQEVVKIHSEFAHMQMKMFHERTKEIGDAVAAATNLVGAVVSLLNWHQVLKDLGRNSPIYKQTGGNEQMRTWSAVPSQERHTTWERE